MNLVYTLIILNILTFQGAKLKTYPTYSECHKQELIIDKLIETTNSKDYVFGFCIPERAEALNRNE